MKHTCPITGIIWHSQYGLGSSAAEHPVLSQKPKELIKNLESLAEADGEASNGKAEADQINEYLYLVAVLKQFPVQFSSPLQFPEAYRKLALHRDSLLRTYAKLDILPTDSQPKYHITSGNADLSNLPYYLESIDEAIKELGTRAAEQRRGRAMLRKQEVMTRLIGHPATRAKNKLAEILADWTDIALTFPRSPTLYKGTYIPLAEYWKLIIRYSVLGDHTSLVNSSVSVSDVEELLQECEDGLELGTSYSHYLLQALRSTLETLRDFNSPLRNVYNFDALDDPSEADTDDDTNTTSSAGPQRSEFPNTKAYLKAVLVWKRSIEHTT